MKSLHHDTELDNAIFFSHYVMVMKDGRMIGGGTIEAYTDDEVQVGNRQYSRTESTFIVSPAPQISINF
ncbi:MULTISPECIES: hypothetical protein [unclassified Paenibacillus]|uniref:hypothetical protein n=1 Tax=unclassified Paenibacillus TaxID=185978 RepID=UPI00070E3B3A|nr:MULTISPECIES: hypothetical protein [unclassified Paenibacillus]KQX68117.1 hypothetical protein ASD40_24860 [Paenibacillus sp. Root444D2]KRE46528.1 hypothetical protein ASG85_29450 [Paenibacillus sp. Soil724D2]